MFIAHRGNDNHKYRENSEKAILFSLQQPYLDGIECDLRLTKDKKIVLLHNILIDFVSDGSGFVHNLTLDELLSYTFEQHQFQDKITVLSSLLSKIESKKILLLEVKEERTNVSVDWIEALKSIFTQYSNLTIYLCSFNYDLLRKLKERYPNILMGLIVGYTMNQNKDITPFEFVMYHYRSFRYTHKMSMIWTMNDKDKVQYYKSKVDYIITDRAYEFV